MIPFRQMTQGMMLGGACCLITGCASPKQLVPFPDQSLVVNDPANARIYVMRPEPFFGAAVRFQVWDGEMQIGQTGGASYLSWERTPGTMHLVNQAEVAFELDETVEAGRRYYYQQTVDMGLFMARSRLLPIVDEKQGETMLARCKEPELKAGRLAVTTSQKEPISVHQEGSEAEALFADGMRYARGQEVPQDWNRAVKFFHEAADAGLAQAQYALALCYLSGKGVIRNQSKAVFWLRQAAEQGHNRAQRKLDEMGEIGQPHL